MRRSLEAWPMQRVAVVAPKRYTRAVLVELARTGMVELDDYGGTLQGPSGPASAAVEQWRRQQGAMRGTAGPLPLVSVDPVDAATLVRDGRIRELLGEAEIERVRAAMIGRGDLDAIAGWCPSEEIGPVAHRIAATGGALVRIRARLGVCEPTYLSPDRVGAAFQPLIDTYGPVPYRDVDPSPLAGMAYVGMFGMMFGDVGRGLLLLAAGLMVRTGRPAVLARARRAAPFLIGAGFSTIIFGLIYGEAFGPTGLRPVWMHPLDHPTTLLAVAVAIGAVLLAVSYCLGIINRWREAGPGAALVSLTGVAGASLYVGLAAVAGGLLVHSAWLAWGGLALVSTGVALGLIGCLPVGERGPGPWLQSSVEVFDATIRIFANTVSFTRLAAFGLTDAALGKVIWSGTTGLWAKGPYFWAAAALVFTAGNAVAFVLEGLIAAIQALRLEYYEMFSRIFTTQGRQFRPWLMAVTSDEAPIDQASRREVSRMTEEVQCSPG